MSSDYCNTENEIIGMEKFKDWDGFIDLFLTKYVDETDKGKSSSVCLWTTVTQKIQFSALKT